MNMGVIAKYLFLLGFLYYLSIYSMYLTTNLVKDVDGLFVVSFLFGIMILLMFQLLVNLFKKEIYVCPNPSNQYI